MDIRISIHILKKYPYKCATFSKSLFELVSVPAQIQSYIFVSSSKANAIQVSTDLSASICTRTPSLVMHTYKNRWRAMKLDNPLLFS